jgi:hypothetical protein
MILPEKVFFALIFGGFLGSVVEAAKLSFKRGECMTNIIAKMVQLIGALTAAQRMHKLSYQ